MKVKSLLCVCLLSLLVACSDDGNDFPKVVPHPEEDPAPDPTSPTGGIEHCQGSVLDVGNKLYYSGPLGGVATNAYDDRAKLTLYTSQNSGTTWDKRQMLYEKASGYSCLTRLKDGRIAMLFEAGPEPGFQKLTDRPKGWCRLDLIVLPN